MKRVLLLVLSLLITINCHAQVFQGGDNAEFPVTGMELLGEYDPLLDSPNLTDGTGNVGDVYRVTAVGTNDFGSGAIDFEADDWVYYDGTQWRKLGSGGAVENYATSDLTSDANRTHSWEHSQTENFDGGSHIRDYQFSAIFGAGTHNINESTSGRDVDITGAPGISSKENLGASDYDRDFTTGADASTLDHSSGRFLVETANTNNFEAPTSTLDLNATNSGFKLEFESGVLPSGTNVFVEGRNANNATELFLGTNAIGLGSATNGQVLTLIDAATGQVEYQDGGVGWQRVILNDGDVINHADTVAALGQSDKILYVTNAGTTNATVNLDLNDAQVGDRVRFYSQRLDSSITVNRVGVTSFAVPNNVTETTILVEAGESANFTRTGGSLYFVDTSVSEHPQTGYAECSDIPVDLQNPAGGNPAILDDYSFTPHATGDYIFTYKATSITGGATPSGGIIIGTTLGGQDLFSNAVANRLDPATLEKTVTLTLEEGVEVFVRSFAGGGAFVTGLTSCVTTVGIDKLLPDVSNPIQYEFTSGTITASGNAASLTQTDVTDVKQFGGNYYVLDDASNTVTELNSGFVSTGFSFSSAAQGILVPTGVVRTATSYYVLNNAGTKAIGSYDLTGASTGSNIIVSPDNDLEGIAFDGTNFWVVGNQTDTIYEVDLAGNFTGNQFSIAAESTNPSGITYYNGQLVVIDTAGILSYWNTTGAFLGSVSGLGTNHEGFAFSPDGTLGYGGNSDFLAEYNITGGTIEDLSGRGVFGSFEGTLVINDTTDKDGIVEVVGVVDADTLSVDGIFPSGIESAFIQQISDTVEVATISGEHIDNTDSLNPIALTWITEQCYEEAQAPTPQLFTGTDYADDNSATTGSVTSTISLTAPLTLSANGAADGGTQPDGDMIKVTTNATNVDGTVILTFDTALDVTIGVERLNGNEITNFVTPIDSMVLQDAFNQGGVGTQAYSGAGNGRNEFTFLGVTQIEWTHQGPNTGFVLYDVVANVSPEPIEHTVRVYDDGSLFDIDIVAVTATKLASIPAAWTVCQEPLSSRVGEFFFAKSGRNVTGIIPVTAGTVTNGAIDYPVWASQYPEYVVGSDIVFPADVEGMFLRNLGGDAAAEGASQADATAVNGLSGVVNRTANNHIATDVNGGGGNNVRFNNTTRNVVFGSSDPETRPINRAYQLYTVVDTYK